MENVIIAQAIIQKQKNEWKAFAMTFFPILGSSAGYREKQSHDCMIGLKAFYPKTGVGILFG